MILIHRQVAMRVAEWGGKAGNGQQPVAYPLLPSRPAEQPTERPTESKEAWLHRELDWQVQVSCHDVTGGSHRCTMHMYTHGICI